MIIRAGLMCALVLGVAVGDVCAAEAPPARKKSEVESVLAKAPKAKGPVKGLYVVMVAGPKDHGPGEHDYPKWFKEWPELLGKAEGVKVATAWEWPSDERQLEQADVVVCYFRGMWDEKKLADIQKVQERGGGLVLIHWAIDSHKVAGIAPRRFGLAYTAAKFRHGTVDLKLTAEHPILTGLPRTMRFVDEPYWPFHGDQSKVTVLATSDEEVKTGEKQPVPVFWTYEVGKGRTFVSIFGHYSWTFDDPYFRLMLLRGIAWAAGEKDNPYRFDQLAVEGVKME